MAQGQSGKALIQPLASFTGADVASSKDATGNNASDQDWELEYRSGSVKNLGAPQCLEHLEPLLTLTADPLASLVSVVDASSTSLLDATSAINAIQASEGTEITAFATLTSCPVAPVRVSFASSGPLEIRVRNVASDGDGPTHDLSITPPLVFTPDNWDIPQELSIQSIEDTAVDGDRTLPIRVSVSTDGMATVTKVIWSNSLDSRIVRTKIAASGTYKETLDAASLVVSNIKRFIDDKLFTSGGASVTMGSIN